MPIYEYECDKCGDKFEVRRSFADDDSDIKCPKCGDEKTHRILSVFSSGGSSAGNCAPSPAGG